MKSISNTKGPSYIMLQGLDDQKALKENRTGKTTYLYADPQSPLIRVFGSFSGQKKSFEEVWVCVCVWGFKIETY